MEGRENMKKETRGFTMVELIVACSIISIILLIAIPQFSLYNSNLKLKKETKRFEGFLKDTRLAAKTQCVDIDMYDCAIAGVTMNVQSPPPCASWIADNWISPAFAAPSTARASQLKAKSIRANYLRIFTFADGLEISDDPYSIHDVMTFTPSGFRDSLGATPRSLQYTIWSASTPKAFVVTLNESGICRVGVFDNVTPGGAGDE
jgi:prepilin-type N-terminal cleavage/methylation domain-containing protein